MVESSNDNGGSDDNAKLNELTRTVGEETRDEKSQSHLLSSKTSIQASELGEDLSTILSIAKDVSLVYSMRVH